MTISATLPMLVRPGDEMQALINQTAPITPSACQTPPCWNLELVDVTRRETAKEGPQHLAPSQASAEWIVEAPEIPTPNDGEEPVFPFPQTNPIAFDNMQVNSQTPVSTTISAITMVNPRGETGNPSALDSDQEGFQVCWGNGTTPVPCSPPGT